MEPIKLSASSRTVQMMRSIDAFFSKMSRCRGICLEITMESRGSAWYDLAVSIPIKEVVISRTVFRRWDVGLLFFVSMNSSAFHDPMEVGMVLNVFYLRNRRIAIWTRL
jgi:hypothetical protein